METRTEEQKEQETQSLIRWLQMHIPLDADGAKEIVRRFNEGQHPAQISQSLSLPIKFVIPVVMGYLWKAETGQRRLFVRHRNERFKVPCRLEHHRRRHTLSVAARLVRKQLRKKLDPESRIENAMSQLEKGSGMVAEARRQLIEAGMYPPAT